MALLRYCTKCLADDYLSLCSQFLRILSLKKSLFLITRIVLKIPSQSQITLSSSQAKSNNELSTNSVFRINFSPRSNRSSARIDFFKGRYKFFTILLLTPPTQSIFISGGNIPSEERVEFPPSYLACNFSSSVIFFAGLFLASLTGLS